MQIGVPVSVASGDVPLVSPPPQVVEEVFVPDLCLASSKFPAQTSEAASQSTTDTTPATLQGQQASHSYETIDTIPIVSLERPGNDGVALSGKDGKETPISVQRDENAAQTAASGADGEATKQTIEKGQTSRQNSATGETFEQKNKGKMWFNVLPVVLQNIKTSNREQIGQLMLPRCAQCEHNRVDQKAAIRCMHKSCIVLDHPLCLVCWKSYHQSVEARKHRRQHTSACPQCHLDWIVYWCAECDLKFCKRCFEQIHSVSTTKFHRKIATEDAPGTSLATSHWSANFQNVIIGMIASRKQMINGSTGGTNIGAKRKRDIGDIIIVIDEDDEDDEDEKEAAIQSVQSDSTLINGAAEQVVSSCESIASQQNGSSTGVENGFTRPSETYPQLQQDALVNTYYQASAAQNSMIVPIPLPQEPMEMASIPLAPFAQQTSSAYSTSSTSNGTMQWDGNTLHFRASSLMGDTGSTACATSGTGNGMMQVTLSSMPTVVNTTSGPWSTASAISTDLSSTSNPNDLLPLEGAVFAENALIDSLVDHYHEVNQNVTSMELQCEQLTRQIAIATCQGPYNAGHVVALLSKLQLVLEAAKERRDRLLIAIIIQSNDIMMSVRHLRLAELGDVRQVPMISHRRCLQLSNEIDQHKKTLVDLYRQLRDTLNRSRAISSSWENSLIRITSANIQMHEKNIKKLNKARKMEFVRIVQFSYNVREALKHAFQRSAEVHRQQQRQQPQFQPSG